MFNTMLGIGASLLTPKIMSGVQNQKVHVVHAAPGRVRLQCKRWKNKQTARNLERVFQSFPMVKTVQASHITGSLLLVFHSQTLTQEQFDNIVKNAVEVSVATYPEIQSDLLVILKNVIETVDATMKKSSGGKIDVDALLSVILILHGALKYSVNPAFASSLFYWAYTIITKQRNER